MEESRIEPGNELVDLIPATQLDFYLPEKDAKESVCTLILKNKSDTAVMFKVKTTAPKDYCVKPNSGQIEVGQQVQVQVMLQPPLPRPALKKDKFLVQTARLDAKLSQEDMANKWKDLAKDEVFESKLKCQWHFDDAAGTGSNDGDASGAGAAAGTAGAASGASDASSGAQSTTAASQPAADTNAPAPSAPTADPVKDEVAAQGPQGTMRRRPDTASSASGTSTPTSKPTKAPTYSSSTAFASSTNNSSAASSVTKQSAALSSSQSSSSSGAKSSSAASSLPSANSAALAAKQAPTDNAHIILLVIAFIIGILFGKIVL